MVCRLCLQNSSEVLEIFNNKGQELKIAMVIGKHFWFEPKTEDPVSSHICHCCWEKLSDFHEFYKYVERAQQLLTVEVIVKTEYKLTVSDITVEDVELATKHELEENITSDVLAEEKYSVIEFEFPPDMKHQSIVNDEKNKDISLTHDDKEDDSGVQFQIKDKKKFLRKKSTKRKSSSERNKVKSFTEKATTTYRVQGPHKGEVAPLKIESNCNEEKAAKPGIYNRPSASNVSDIINNKISEYMQLKCDVCDAELDTFAHIRYHMRSVHGARPYVKCCEKKFSRRSMLYDHIKFHLNPNIYRCEKCDKVFSDRRTFSNHDIYMHQSEDSKIFQCPQCPKKYARKYLLQQHKTRQHYKVLKKYFCPECKIGFPFMSCLTSHVALKHGTKCDICSEVVKGPVAFNRHQLKHQHIDEPKMQCDLCGSWCKGELNLARHKKRHTNQEL